MTRDASHRFLNIFVPAEGVVHGVSRGRPGKGGYVVCHRVRRKAPGYLLSYSQTLLDHCRAIETTDPVNCLLCIGLEGR